MKQPEPGRWLVKQEPSDYGWPEFARDRRTAWTGVRNAQARIHLRAMKKADEVMFYHSGDEKAVVGIARVVQSAYPDPTSEDPGWVAVDLVPVKALPRPVTLADIKAEPALKELGLVRQSRLSVMPVPEASWDRLLAMAGL